MPRNGTGTYTLPRPPFVPGTVISSADVNADLSDIATALTGSLSSNGETALTAALRGPISVSPAYTFVGDVDTGFGSDATDTAYIRAGGVRNIFVTANSFSTLGTGTFGGAVQVTAGGLTVVAGGITITAGGLTITLGGATITGNSTVTGTFGVSGNYAVATNKFTVDAATGNTAVAGTLNVAGAATVVGLLLGRQPLLQIQDQQSSGGAGQTLTSGIWNTARFNTEATDELGVTLASNSWVLPVGTYNANILVSVGWQNTASTQDISVAALLRIRNTTAGTTILTGMPIYIRDGNSQNFDTGGAILAVPMRGRITVAAAQTIEVQIYILASNAGVVTQGRPLAQGVEIYSDAMFTQVTN